MSYFSNTNSSKNTENQQNLKMPPKIYTISRKSDITTYFSKPTPLPKITKQYQLLQNAPSKNEILSKISGNLFIQNNEIYFSQPDDFQYYQRNLEKINFKPRHAVKLTEKLNEPDFCKIRKNYMKFEEISQFRRKILYEAEQNGRPKIYEFLKNAPSTKFFVKSMEIPCVFENSSVNFDDLFSEKMEIKENNQDFTNKYQRLIFVEIFCILSNNRPYNFSIDQICAIFIGKFDKNSVKFNILEISDKPKSKIIMNLAYFPNISYYKFKNEKELLQKFIEIYNKNNYFCGFDTQRFSINYIFQRISIVLPNVVVQKENKIIFDIISEISRKKPDFLNYEYENLCYKILNQIVAKFSASQLKNWYKNRETKIKIFEYFLQKIKNEFVFFM